MTPKSVRACSDAKLSKDVEDNTWEKYFTYIYLSMETEQTAAVWGLYMPTEALSHILVKCLLRGSAARTVNNFKRLILRWQPRFSLERIDAE